MGKSVHMRVFTKAKETSRQISTYQLALAYSISMQELVTSPNTTQVTHT